MCHANTLQTNPKDFHIREKQKITKNFLSFSNNLIILFELFATNK